MKERIIKLRFILDRLTLRERVMILATTLLLILMMWLFVFFLPQNAMLNSIQQAIAEEKKQAAFFAQKRKTIEQLASDVTLLQLVKTHQGFKEAIDQVEHKITRFKNRYISSQQLSNLLHAILQKTNGVSIENFTDVLDSQEQPEQKEAYPFAEKPKSAANTKASQSVLPEMLSTFKEMPGQRTQYILTLTGDYFSIMNYLIRLEQIPWQLYWDKLNYKVQAYPQGKVVLEFYTLKPVNGQSVTGGSVK